MTMRAASYAKLIILESELKYLTNTSFKFNDLHDLHRRLNFQPVHPITQKLKESGLVEAAIFPMVVQAPELIRECIERYDPKMKKILLPN